MGLFSFGKNSQSQIDDAEQAITKFTAQKELFEREKQEKMQRQVELWSVMTPSSDLESEYKEVTGQVALLVKKLLTLEEYLKQLQLAKFHCKSGQCADLTKLLLVSDPTASISADIPVVNY